MPRKGHVYFFLSPSVVIICHTLYFTTFSQNNYMYMYKEAFFCQLHVKVAKNSNLANGKSNIFGCKCNLQSLLISTGVQCQ